MTPEETEAGLLAYERVQAFASLRRKKMPALYFIFDLLVLVIGVAMTRAGFPTFGIIVIVGAVLLSIYSGWNWRRLSTADAANRALLARLHLQYGDDLPWLEVERQTAEICRIEAERLKPPGDPSG